MQEGGAQHLEPLKSTGALASTEESTEGPLRHLACPRNPRTKEYSLQVGYLMKIHTQPSGFWFLFSMVGLWSLHFDARQKGNLMEGRVF